MGIAERSINTYLDWRSSKEARRIAYASLPRKEREYLVERLRESKLKILADLEVNALYNRDYTSRGLLIGLFAGIERDRTHLRRWKAKIKRINEERNFAGDDHVHRLMTTEYVDTCQLIDRTKTTIYRRIEQARTHRAFFGLAPFLHGFSRKFSIDPNTNFVPVDDLSKARRDGYEFVKIELILTDNELWRVSRREHRRKHKGLWSMSDAGSSNHTKKATFWFEHATDLMMFKLETAEFADRGK